MEAISDLSRCQKPKPSRQQGCSSLKVAMQMDPIETIDIDTDTSFAIALEAQMRGHQVFHYLPTNLSMHHGRVTAKLQPLSLKHVHGDHYCLGEKRSVDITEMDIVMIRQDPPFDMSYITNTFLLEALPILVINNPAGIRSAPEKLFTAMRFADLTPPTLITRDTEAMTAFRLEHRSVIIKPLHGNGGFGVFHIKPEDTNFDALIELFMTITKEPFILQSYLPEVTTGDKRVILIDGEPEGAINRKPLPGKLRANMHAGGQAEPARLDKEDYAICACIGPELRRLGIMLAGIDIIGNKLTEINVTSPTGIQEIERFNGTSLTGRLWDQIEARFINC